MNPDRYVPVGNQVYIDLWSRNRKPPRFSVAEAIVVVVIIMVLAAILFPVFSKTHCYDHRYSCGSNLKQIGLAIMQYAQDNNDRYPLARVNDTGYATGAPYDTPYGWADALYAYSKSTEIFYCPSVPSHWGVVPRNACLAAGPNPVRPGFTDYWFNRNLSGSSTNSVVEPAKQWVNGDGNRGDDLTTARYSLTHLPLLWRNDHTTPPYRHQDGANYAYADGHVKYLKGDFTNVPVHNYPLFDSPPPNF